MAINMQKISTVVLQHRKSHVVELKCATLEKITRNINKGKIVNLKSIFWAQSRRMSILLTKKDWRAC